MNASCYIAVSDLALCQRCPALLAYKIHMGRKSAWRIGIRGNGESYGTVFHRHISRVFFDAASKPYHKLHAKICDAVSEGKYELENVIRENIFIPFLEDNSERFKSGQIIAMAKGISVWVKAMSDFFRCIPSLTRHSNSYMHFVFAEPEQKLKSSFVFDDGTLYITGCYDALMFNPDKREARLFEFKAYMKSDITVPLSQSLIYAWLIWRNTGIIPSVEIIYLDEEDRKPDIFDSRSVGSMMSPTLPELFHSAFSILTLRRKPKILQDKVLCSSCRYREHCEKDMTNLFTKRKGSSLVSVLVFFLIALMITAQVFFFIENSAESLSEERGMMQIRLKLDELVDSGKDALIHEVVSNEVSPCIGFISRDYHNNTYTVYDKEYGKDFFLFSDSRKNPKNKNDSKTKLWEDTTGNVSVFDLNYYLLYTKNDLNGIPEKLQEMKNAQKPYDVIFPPQKDNYYLIRARIKLPAGNYIMRQVVVEKSGSDLYTHSSEEVFYW